MLGYIKLRKYDVIWDFCSSGPNFINLFIHIDNNNLTYMVSRYWLEYRCFICINIYHRSLFKHF